MHLPLASSAVVHMNALTVSQQHDCLVPARVAAMGRAEPSGAEPAAASKRQGCGGGRGKGARGGGRGKAVAGALGLSKSKELSYT